LSAARKPGSGKAQTNPPASRPSFPSEILDFRFQISDFQLKIEINLKFIKNTSRGKVLSTGIGIAEGAVLSIQKNPVWSVKKAAQNRQFFPRNRVFLRNTLVR
jgi:hypothetical protein